VTPLDLIIELDADKSLADLARAYNVDLQQLKDVFVASIKTQIEAAVKDGKATQAEADFLNSVLPGAINTLVNFHASSTPENYSQGAGQDLDAVVNAAATALNMTPQQFVSELRAGKMISDLAKAQNVDIQQVKAAVLTIVKAELDKQVEAGKINRQQADKGYQVLTSVVDELVK
jgi:uncharacterized protein (DUF433 family)